MYSSSQESNDLFMTYLPFGASSYDRSSICRLSCEMSSAARSASWSSTYPSWDLSKTGSQEWRSRPLRRFFAFGLCFLTRRDSLICLGLATQHSQSLSSVIPGSDQG